MVKHFLETSDLGEVLAHDNKVKVAAVDTDGILRGKILSVEKFLAVATKGFGFSSAVFGWDMHDQIYTTETSLASDKNGFADFTAVPDLSTYRRVSWEDSVPFFLVDFFQEGQEVPSCGRQMLRSTCNKLAEMSCVANAGVELEFTNFRTPGKEGYRDSKPNLAAFLNSHSPTALDFMTEGMFGYSVTRPSHNKDYFYDIYNTALEFDCPIEGWHTESGPGVYEAALKVAPVNEMADRVVLFKYLTKSTGVKYGITPCFMAKPAYGLAGNSGHIHISLSDSTGRNMFARELPDTSAPWPDVANLSDLGRHFLAGVLLALPDIMPMLAPTVNSYKRLVENYWAPVYVNWGLEDRIASLRLIASPESPKATRLEIRIPGADLHPHYALNAILAAGWWGVQKELPIPVPPRTAVPGMKFGRLPVSLQDATQRFKAPGSIAREILGDEFVDFFAASREHELNLFNEAVTDWEFRRYVETV